MSQQADDTPPFDPAGMWRSMRDASADAWARVLIQLVTSEEYARATGALLDAYLATSEPFRKQIEKLLIEFVQSEAYAQATRQTLDAYLATTAPFRNALIEVVRSEAFAKVAGELFDQYLTTSAPLREALETAVLKALAQVITSPRGDIGQLAERLDPTGLWRTMRGAGMDLWAGLATAAPFREAIAATMTQTLTQLNMSTRGDVTSLAARLDQIETRLDAIEAKLDPPQQRHSIPSSQRSSGNKEAQ